MAFSDDFITELKEKIDIEEIISGYVEIQRKGRNLMGVCPFHAERTPSFCVYPSSGSFYCFGCGAGGDVITFLRLIEHWDYVETVKFLCEKAGMNYDISDEESEAHRAKLNVYKINREAAKFYHKCLLSEEGEKAREYLTSRKIKASTAVHFGLGYSPASRFGLVNHLKKMGFKSDEIIMSNLAFKSRNGKDIDRFCGRLMFPIIDVRGNVIAFGARTLTGETPKYINTSDTPVFKKSSNLFALNFASKSSEKNLILTEGYMDVIALHQAGFTNAVATLGTSLTPSQVKVMSRYCEEVLLSYDSDGPGKKASERAISLLKEAGVKVKIISIPEFKDPDEFLRFYGNKAKDKFSGLVNDSKSDLEYQLSALKEKCDLNTSDGKIKYLTGAAKLLASSATMVEKEVYAILISEELGVRKSTVLLQTEKYVRQFAKKSKTKEFKNIEKKISAIDDKVNKDKHTNLRAAHAEESLISCIINDANAAKRIISEVSSDVFATEFNKRVFEVLKDIISKGKTPDITVISGYEFSFKEIGRITKMICTYDRSMSKKECIDEYISTLKEEKERKKFSEINDISEVEIQNYIKNLNIQSTNN